jgi:hypothetical protein
MRNEQNEFFVFTHCLLLEENLTFCYAPHANALYSLSHSKFTEIARVKAGTTPRVA